MALLTERSTLWPEISGSRAKPRRTGILHRAGRAFGYLVSHYSEYILAGHVPISDWDESWGVRDGDHDIVDSLEKLEKVAFEIPPGLILDKVTEAVSSGKTLLLHREQVTEGTTARITGLSVCERGGVLKSLGRVVPLSDQWLLTHYAFVFPEFRGRQRAFELMKFRARYAHQLGITLFCGAISLRNAESLKAHFRTAYVRVITTVHCFSFLGGKYAWTTSARRIEDALERLGREAKELAASSGTANNPDPMSS